MVRQKERRERWILVKTTTPMVLAAMSARYTVVGERRTFFDIVARQAQSLARVLPGSSDSFS